MNKILRYLFMTFFLKKSTLLLIVYFLLSGCSVIKNYSLKSFISPGYKSVDFSYDSLPLKPDYSSNKSWAVLPSKYPTQLSELLGNYNTENALVFYIYPTLLLDPDDTSWNADIFDQKARKDVIDKAIKYQASAWARAGKLYAPYYRQAHIRIFDSKYYNQGKEAGEVAYFDLKEAFEYFLKNYANNQPIIIASHSQGTIHAKRLLQEYFDGTDIQKYLVAAYLIGARIKENDFKFLKPMTSHDEIGGYVSWNTYKKNKYPEKYESWFKGGVTSNPISWDNKIESDYEDHLGLLYINDKFYSKSVKINIKDGLLWTSIPRVPNRFLLSFIKNYHYADINLFWLDIQQNSIDRIKAWNCKNNL